MHKRILRQMDEALEELERVDIMTTPNVKIMVAIRNALYEGGVKTDFANNIVANMECRVSLDTFLRDKEKILSLAERMGKVMAKTALDLINRGRFDESNVIAMAKDFQFIID